MELWVEKYRPQTMNDYVWRNLETRATVEAWIKQGCLPHVLLTGKQGTGKTSLAKLLFRELDIPDMDLMYINASRERQVDALQDRIVRFVDAWAINPSGIKYILLDEMDRLSPTAQAFLRNEMESYAEVCRFVGTANYPERIVPALHSRFQEIQFSSLDLDSYAMRAVDVLERENIRFDPDDVMSYVNQTHPDLRKCINLLQQHSRDGKLNPLAPDEGSTKDYLLAVAEMFKKGQHTEARKLIIDQAQPEEYNDIYRFFYENMGLFASTPNHQDEGIVLVAKYLFQHPNAADPEINLSACMIELSHLTDE